MLTMRAASLCNKAGTQARIKIGRAVRLISTVLSQRVSKDASSSNAPPPREMPALFIRIFVLCVLVAIINGQEIVTHVKSAKFLNDLLTHLLDPTTICDVAYPAFCAPGVNSVYFINDKFHPALVQI